MVSSTAHSDSHKSTSKAPLRLAFLDGLRGLAALYVVFHHAIGNVTFNPQRMAELPGYARSLLMLFHFGSFAVSIFIVLSGYCLMLPATRSSDRKVPRGWPTFFRRRAMRILPPYYAALALSLLAVILIPALRGMTYSYWDDAQPALNLHAIVLHLLLLHNADPNTVFKINYALWSIASEWQIYFVFPLLLVVWRKWGVTACAVAAFALGIFIELVVRIFDSGRPWYIGLFALGMVAAVVTQTPSTWIERWKRRLWWDALAVLFMAIAVEATLKIKHDVIADTFVGLSTVCAIIYLCGFGGLLAKSRGQILRWLESRPVTHLGNFSYSLYLIHPVVLALVALAMRMLALSPVTWTIVNVLVCVAASLVAAQIFYVSIERYCIPSKTSKSLSPPGKKPIPQPVVAANSQAW